MENVKTIISKYINIDAANINGNTLIDGTVLKGSIFLHRMYADLGKAGYHFENYSELKTFNDLLQQSNKQPESIQKQIFSTPTADNTFGEQFIGIDLEYIDNLPKAIDFREDSFYIQNFSQKEIAYCILQKNPYNSFAGIFAAKESIVKAQNEYLNLPFNQIEIEHSKEGKPKFKNFSISISHNVNLAIAIAVLNNSDYDTKNAKQEARLKDLTTHFEEKLYQLRRIKKTIQITLLLTILLIFVSLIFYGIKTS